MAKYLVKDWKGGAPFVSPKNGRKNYWYIIYSNESLKNLSLSHSLGLLTI